MVQLTEKQKYEIIVKHEMGMNNVEISKTMNINRGTVINWLNRYTTTNTINRKSGSGRKKFENRYYKKN